MAFLKEECLSIDDYLEGELHSEVKHEYLGGAVHAMAGAKARHNFAAGNVYGSLHVSLSGKRCRPMNSDTKVRIDLPMQTRFYYPDVQVVCDRTGDDSLFEDQPVVIIEVLSDSTRRVDLGEKHEAYLAVPSLRVLIIIDPTKVWVQVDRRGESGGFTQEHYRDLGEVVALPEIEAELKLAEIYEGIDLG